MTKKRTKKRYYRRKKRKNTTIYEISLRDKSRTYYYIGKANNPYARLEVHKSKALNNIGRNERKNEMFKRHLNNLRLRILERPKMKDWRKRERYWIKHYRNKYGRDMVLNASDGGDGEDGGGWPSSKSHTSPFVTTFALLCTILFICACLYLMR